MDMPKMPKVRTFVKRVEYAIRHPVTYAKLCIIGGGLYLAQTQAVGAQTLASADTLPRYGTDVSISPALRVETNRKKSIRNFTQVDISQKLPLGRWGEVSLTSQTRVETQAGGEPVLGIYDEPGKVREQVVLDTKSRLLDRKESGLTLGLGGYLANNPDLVALGIRSSASKGFYTSLTGRYLGLTLGMESGIEWAGDRAMNDAVLKLKYAIPLGFINSELIVGAEQWISRTTMRQTGGFYFPFSNAVGGSGELKIDFGKNTAGGAKFYGDKYCQKYSGWVQFGQHFGAGMDVIHEYNGRYDASLHFARANLTFRY